MNWQRSIALTILLFPASAFCEGWEGKTVMVRQGSLMCTYFHMERAITLQKAGDEDSIRAYIQNDYCLLAPKRLHGSVVSDTSSFSEDPMIEVVIRGESIWTSKYSADCCYKNSNGEMVKIGAPPPRRRVEKNCTDQEAIDAFVANEKRQGAENVSPPPAFIAPNLPCPEDY